MATQIIPFWNPLTREYINITVIDGAIQVSGHNKGWFVNEAALNAAYPTASAGDIASIGSGGVGPVIYAWDVTTLAWENTLCCGLVTSVNSKTGAVVLTTTDIAEGTKLYYTEVRVSANSDVAAAAAHLLDTGNPHSVTAAQTGAAPAAEGVTNGDTHDHAGGDGAQIDHTGLSNKGTNTHAQIDTAVSNSVSHIGNTSNPHSVTASQAGLGNVTNNAQVKKISSSTDNAITRWDGTSGDTPQDSLATIDDSGSINIPSGQAYKINGKLLIRVTTLESSASITPDADSTIMQQLFMLSLAHSGTMNAISNPVAGCKYTFIITNTASYTLAWAAVYLFPGGQDHILSLSAKDSLKFDYDGTNFICTSNRYGLA